MGSYATNGQQYALIADLQTVLSPQALTHPVVANTATQNSQLLKASELIDGYLRQQFQLPLVTWGSDIVQACCDIAAYRLICLRGFNPEADGSYLDNFKMQRKWLESVANAAVSPDLVDGTSGAAPGQQTTAAEPLAFSPSEGRCTGKR